MTMRSAARTDAGFTMVEVMVSAALVALGVLGLAFQMAAQKNTKGSTDTENIGRRVMTRLVDIVMAQPTHFPYFQNAGKGIVYVGCFDASGGPVNTDPAASIPNVKDYIGVWSIDPSSAAQFSVALTGANLVCTQAGLGGYEVHVAPSPGDALGPKVAIAAIPLGVGSSTIQASNQSVFTTSIRLAGMPLIPTPSPFASVTFTGTWCPTAAGNTCVGAACGGTTVCFDQYTSGDPNDYCFCY